MKTSSQLAATAAGLAFALTACGPQDASETYTNPGPTAGNGSSSGQAVPLPGSVGGFIAGGSGTGGLGGLFTDGDISMGGGVPPRLAEMRTAAEPPPPIAGGTLAVSGDGNHVVAADPDRDMVYVVELASLQVKKVSLPAGSEPGRVAFDDQGGAHVALRGTDKLVRVDLASASVVGECDVCSHPRGLAFDATNHAMVATCMDGQMVSVDAASLAETQRDALPQDLRDVVVGDAGARWVARYRSAELLSLQADRTVKSASKPRPIQTLNFSGGGIPLALDVQPGPADAGVMAPPGLPVSNASPTLAWRALPSKQGGVWMLHQQSEDGEIVIGEGGYGSGCQAITSGAVTEFASDGTPSRSMPVNLQGLSVDMALSPDEKWLALASPGGYVGSQPTVQVYSTDAMQSGDLPAGSCGSPNSAAGDENQTVAVAFGGDGVLYSLSREPAELTLYQLDTSSVMSPFVSVTLTRTATIALDLSSRRDTGHDLFHADVGQGLACASCHGEATDDGHVWNFQKIGPRRTQNMRGGLLATAPFHWDGDMADIGHLVDDVMTQRMGGFKVDATYASALGQWIDQQPELALPVADDAAVARGKQLFESSATGCATCHSGPSFTNNQSADVGTGGAFQVPALLGLALRPPYMHNGCAQTLEDRFDAACGGGDKHGTTSQLSDAQRADLIAYLSSL